MTRSAVKSLEERITERLWRFGPVIALGHPGDVSPPVGAARKYISCATDDDWQKEVKSFSEKCSMIVLVAGHTKGIFWEMKHILEQDLFDRLLLIIPPGMTGALWAEFCTCAEVERLMPPFPLGSGADRLLGLSFLHGRATSYVGAADQFGYEAVSLIGAAEILSQRHSA